jgi:hypothetical protein
MKSVRTLPLSKPGIVIPAIKISSPDRRVIATTGTATRAGRFLQKTKFANAATGVAKKNAFVSHRMKPVHTTGIVSITEKKYGQEPIIQKFVMRLGFATNVPARIRNI